MRNYIKYSVSSDELQRVTEEHRRRRLHPRQMPLSSSIITASSTRAE